MHFSSVLDGKYISVSACLRLVKLSPRDPLKLITNVLPFPKYAFEHLWSKSTAFLDSFSVETEKNLIAAS